MKVLSLLSYCISIICFIIYVAVGRKVLFLFLGSVFILLGGILRLRMIKKAKKTT